MDGIFQLGLRVVKRIYSSLHWPIRKEAVAVCAGYLDEMTEVRQTRSNERALVGPGNCRGLNIRGMR
jgi:hypothetical protein